MKKYDKRKIMLMAWELFRKLNVSFKECLHRAWLSAKGRLVNQERIAKAKANANVQEEVHSWNEWKTLGYEVIHGSKALFSCELIWGSKGNGKTYKASFFGLSQVQPI